MRVYPVNRIDKPVSGIVVFAKLPEGHRLLQENWPKDSTEKTYLTLCKGRLEFEGQFDFPLKNLNNKSLPPKESLSLYYPLELFNNYTYLSVVIKTGRKHQIRRQFSRRCHNLVGDSTYGKGVINTLFRKEFGLNQIFLHAHKLSFEHPYSKKSIEILCPLPDSLGEILEKLRIKGF